MTDSNPISNRETAKAMKQLLFEVQKGFDSAKQYGWVSEKDAYRLLKVSKDKS